MAEYVEAASDSGRRHYGVHMRPVSQWPGHRGVSLCTQSGSTSSYTAVYDDDARKAWADYYRLPFKPAATLPLCKRCEREAAKRPAEVTP